MNVAINKTFQIVQHPKWFYESRANTELYLLEIQPLDSDWAGALIL